MARKKTEIPLTAAGKPDKRSMPGTNVMTPERLARLEKGRETRAANAKAAREAKEAGAEMTRYQRFRKGLLKLEEWDNEEVARGQLKDRAGNWAGVYNQRFTAREQAAIKRELLKRGQQSFDGMYLEGLGYLRSVILSSAAEDKDRLKALQIMIDRVAGKVPDRLEVGGTDAFADVLQGVLDDGVLVPADLDPDAEG